MERIINNIHVISNLANENTWYVTTEERDDGIWLIPTTWRQRIWIYLFAQKKNLEAVSYTFHEDLVWIRDNANRDMYIDPQSDAAIGLFYPASKYNQILHYSRLNQDAYPLFKSLPFLEAIDTITEINAMDVGAFTEPYSIDLALNEAYVTEVDELFGADRRYYYNELRYGTEKMRDLLWINAVKAIRKILSQTGRVLEKIASYFGIKWSPFKNLRYFRKPVKPSDYMTNDPMWKISDKKSYYHLGHSSGILTLPLSNGDTTFPLNILFDPIEDAVIPWLIDREIDTPKMSQVLGAVHIILLTHNHPDHFSPCFLEALLVQNSLIVVPRKMGHELVKLGFDKSRIIELNWWEQISITVAIEDESYPINLTALPVAHGSRSTLFNGNGSLYQAYAISGHEKDVLAIGDTARLKVDMLDEYYKYFDFSTILGPAGPDKPSPFEQWSHQTAADNLWVHTMLFLRNIYEIALSKTEFLAMAQEKLTLVVHTNTYNMGFSHFQQTNDSIAAIIDALIDPAKGNKLESYERSVLDDLIREALLMQLSPDELAALLSMTLGIPLFGQLIELD